MYVYVCVCMCISVCMYITVYVCVRMCMYVYVCVSAYVCVCMCMYVYVCICMCMYVYVAGELGELGSGIENTKNGFRTKEIASNLQGSEGLAQSIAPLARY